MPWYVAEIDTVMVSMGKDAAPVGHVVLGSENIYIYFFLSLPSSGCLSDY